MTLTDFILQRIAEDEAVAGELPADGYYTDDQRVLEVPPDAAGLAWPRRWSPVRVLAECEAKRRIIAEHAEISVGGEPRCSTCCEEWGDYYVGSPATEKPFPSPTIRALAAVYADHADYREEWRP